MMLKFKVSDTDFDSFAYIFILERWWTTKYLFFASGLSHLLLTPVPLKDMPCEHPVYWLNTRGMPLLEYTPVCYLFSLYTVC
jgi:hypothetical protein